MESPQDAVHGLGNVLIVGGCGLVGHALVRFLIENGKPEGEISDVSAVIKLTNPKVIINFASPDPMNPDKSVFGKCNIVGVQNIIECAQEQGVPVLVHSSSCEIIQDAYHDLIWANEEWPVQDSPVNGSIYAKTKAIGEELVLSANRQKGLLTVAIRLCTTFGEGDNGLTRQFIELGKKGMSKYQIGPGQNLYDFIYAGNAAEGHLLAAQILLHPNLSPGDKRIDGEAFNMTNGDPWRFWDAARFVSNAAGYPVKEEQVWKLPMAVVCLLAQIWGFMYALFTLGGEPEVQAKMLRYTGMVRTFDITKARGRLGYKPRVSMEDGLRRAVRWHLERAKK
ncbi:putative sterol-4-alpha-carboxylate 3-dehydrogenase, decarboxylating [Periconia macrospinosa]|uniref:Putative sterol-4-alpha-carboxylate 3-dehydrogenase, decarboxylating n=1 Tax=Periconia macrospinosa TaxID=97972 RepID=A0A2V1DG06_9PLEO|nr:putative sterol-4-alpha-carboxylate 3-dehydrogenase, decarboxylating [Periconia macrospinosa]